MCCTAGSGNTFFGPQARRWIYESPEPLASVPNVSEGDAVTIPLPELVIRYLRSRVHLVHRGRAILDIRPEQRFHHWRVAEYHDVKLTPAAPQFLHERRRFQALCRMA